ncbi:MAG: hypothetical protein EAZ07_09280 [Cytophagales bacterium]|nr:MAG: hypothetical protein EAZ07_09280 [Cytophagales bacterium]
MPDILGNTIIDGRNNSEEVVFKSGYLILYGDEVEINSITFRGYFLSISANSKTNRIINCKFYKNIDGYTIAINTNNLISITPNVRIFNCYFEKFTEALSIANGNFILEKNTFKNNETAIYCYSIPRPIGTISPTVSSFNNTFDENTSVGISNTLNTLQSSQDIFTNTPDGAKAITSNKSAPVITSVSENNGIITI